MPTIDSSTRSFMPCRSHFIRASVRSVARTLTVVSGMLLAACGGDDPQVPSALAPLAATTISGAVASLVTETPSVRITDTKGRNIKGVMVRWRVTSGGGRVTNDSVRTDGNGVASSGGWVLGNTAGTQTLQATADGVSATLFTAEAAPGPVSRLVRLSADAQQAQVGTAVIAAPSVRAEDQFSNPVPNVAVTFTVTSGTGSVTGDLQTTNAQGVATAQAWTLGTQVGAQVVRATALGATAAVFGATAVAGPPTAILKLSGDNQQGVPSAPVPIAPGVRVVDAFGNPIGNVPVTFTPGPNSGTVTPTTVNTDPANGTAFVGNWTLGAATTQTLLASSTQLPGVFVTFSANAVPTLFDLEVRFVGNVTNPVVRQAFLNAAAKWRSVIVGDLHTTRLTNVPAAECQDWIPAINENVNDVLIFARIGPIDGTGSGGSNILGQASACAVNTATNLTAYGFMEFDEVDMEQLVAEGTLSDVIVHEMGHVLGIGILWNFRRGLLTGEGTSDPFFSGTSARTQFAALNTVQYSGNPVPVENSGGDGTRDAHWRETVLGRELMTGFLNSNGGNPLSRITAGSLQDLGYTVNLGAADQFSLTAALRYTFPFVGSADVRMVNDVKRTPIMQVYPDGRRVRLAR